MRSSSRINKYYHEPHLYKYRYLLIYSKKKREIYRDKYINTQNK